MKAGHWETSLDHGDATTYLLYVRSRGGKMELFSEAMQSENSFNNLSSFLMREVGLQKWRIHHVNYRQGKAGLGLLTRSQKAGPQARRQRIHFRILLLGQQFWMRSSWLPCQSQTREVAIECSRWCCVISVLVHNMREKEGERENWVFKGVPEVAQLRCGPAPATLVDSFSCNLAN